MKSQSLLIIGVLAVAVIAVLAATLPGLSSPQPPGSVPTPTPAPVPGNGTYINATYGYAVTCPEGWFYTESGESVWFSSPDRHEEVRVNTNPLSGQEAADEEKVLEALNATYVKDLKAGIDAEWVSTERTSLDGVPAYESVFSVPIVEEDRYTFVIRYAVRGDVVYSVMHTVFPEEY
ncbi:PsbP-related protein, partial [Methanoculleus sp.]|uniref:PsbP-related protein n=1 Tax=Methanoculleus sp. TaxID=90427 RepID=UPI0025D056DE